MPRWHTERSGTTLQLLQYFGPDGRSGEVSSVLLERRPSVRSPDFEIFRRRFSAVAHNFEFDLLTFIERGQTGFLHSRNVNKYILSATLWLNESIAFGRIEPLHGTRRHQNSPRDKERSEPTLHILVTVAIPSSRHAKRRAVVSAIGTTCPPRAGARGRRVVRC
jgi:hypothetical protein